MHDNVQATPSLAVPVARAGVAFQDGHYHIVAREACVAGDLILEIDGLYVVEPTQYSIQVGTNLHVTPPPDLDRDRDTDRYRWRYLNHSCDPNCRVAGQHLIARRDIAQWEEVTFDYCSTEYELSTPFVCRCGKCEGHEVRGFKYLGLAARARLAPDLAPHLAARLVDERSA